jgi:hypothetical protein
LDYFQLAENPSGISSFNLSRIEICREGMSSYVNQRTLGEQALPIVRQSISAHESLECGASFGELWQTGGGTFEVREKFLVLIDGLVAFPRALVDLAETVVGEELNRREALFYRCKIRANAGGTNLGSTNQRLIDRVRQDPASLSLD